MARSRRIVLAFAGLIGTGGGYACSCVAAGSRVRTPTGEVDIASLQVGDLVLSFDVETGVAEASPIVAIRRARRECLALRIGARRLVCTPEHPIFAVDTSAFEPASAFAVHAGRPVRIAGDDAWRVGLVDAIEVYAGVHDVLDITVESRHHNFVAEGVIVHNKSPAPTQRIKFVCDPSDDEVEQCPGEFRCCSDDPEPSFTESNNRFSNTGFCAVPSYEYTEDDEILSIDCPRACNPKWPGRHVADVCGIDVPCCQTNELLPADCIRDAVTGLWRTMDGRDAEAAALRGDARWGDAGTHQDPDFSGCEAIAGARTGEVFLECVRGLGVADQRGFCGGNPDLYYGDESGPCAVPSVVDICARRNESSAR